MDWQNPTTWSRETKDGSYYIERKTGTERLEQRAGWFCYHLYKPIGESDNEDGAKALCERHAVEAGLSKRAKKLLARVRAGEYYPIYDANGPRGPKAMEELAQAGLVGRSGRSKILEACWVPLGYYPREEKYPTHRHKKGGLYTVLHAEALHSETKEPMVVYVGTDGQVWVRPKAMFEDGRFSPIGEDGNG